jgi:hypothetical protein
MDDTAPDVAPDVVSPQEIRRAPAYHPHRGLEASNEALFVRFVRRYMFGKDGAANDRQQDQGA